MNSQIMKKEEDIEKLEEEVVTLRVKVIKLNKNIEETKASTSSTEVPKRKNEEKPKIYAYWHRGRPRVQHYKNAPTKP